MYTNIVAQYESNISLVSNGFGALKNAINTISTNGDNSSFQQNHYQHAIHDIVDIQHGLQEQVNTTVEALELAEEGQISSLQEQLAAFTQQVMDIFVDLFQKFQDKVMQQNYAAFTDDIRATRDQYLNIEANFSLDIQIVVHEKKAPQIPPLSLVAMQTVSQASISERDKQDFIEMIAMIDEFVYTAAHGHLLQAIIALVPLIEQITPASQVDMNIANIYDVLTDYVEHREHQRREAGPVGQWMHDRRHTDSYTAFAFSLSYSRSESYFQTTA